MHTPDFETFQSLSSRGNLIPVYREILADTETPVTVLMKHRLSSRLFVLESVEGGEKWGRYTFLGSDPSVVFIVRGEEIVIEEKGSVRRCRHGGDPLRHLKELLGSYRAVPVEGLPRFFGGAVGFLGYGMIRYFESRLAGNAGEPGTDDAVFLLADTLMIFDNVRHTLKVVACASTEGKGSLREAYDEAVARVDRLVGRLREPGTSAVGADLPGSAGCGLPGRKGPDKAGSHGGPFRSNMEPEAFKAIVRRAREYIAAGDVIQVVLSQRFEKENPVDPVDLYRALRYINPSPYLFFLRLDGLTLVGSSPEVMVRLEDGVAELRPIAGTRRRGKTEQEDRRLADELLEDPKERAEHVMLVDLGRNDLGRIARTGSVQVSQLMAVERYSHVMHLVSHVQAHLAPGKDWLDVLRATFPAGTLSGAPKIRAMEIIDELEPSRRGVYGGAVGYVSFTGNMDLCITIRTMAVREGKVFIQAGAGIVADSDPETEYRETVSKAEGMMRAFDLAASGFDLSRQGG
jgi:anthranilate synthase component 1